MLPALSDAVGEKIAEMDSTIALKRAGRDAEALALIQRNRGKALMDEINVFLYGAILLADEGGALGSAEQQRNASLLRRISAVAAAVIVLVVLAVTFMVYRNGRDLKLARDEVQAINLSLEERVKARTADLAMARERAEVLLAEVNHRVANSLQLVGNLVRMQVGSATDKATREALLETQSRINAIALIHKSLYTSGDVTRVALNDYLGTMLGKLLAESGGAEVLRLSWFDLDGVPRMRRKPAFRALLAVAARAFRFIQGLVGIVHQARKALAGDSGGQADADRRVESSRYPAGTGGLESHAHRLGKLSPGLDTRAGEQDGEFFAADTTRDDFRRCDAADMRAKAGDDHVPHRVAVRVVDPFEMVEIGDQQRGRTAAIEAPA